MGRVEFFGSVEYLIGKRLSCDGDSSDGDDGD